MKKLRDFIKFPKKEQILFIGFIRKGMTDDPQKPVKKDIKEQYWPKHHPEYNAHMDGADTNRTDSPYFHHANQHLATYKDDNVDASAAINSYTGSQSRFLNAHLLKKSRAKIPHSKKMSGVNIFPREIPELKLIDRHLSHAIKLNKTPSDMHVFSGISFTPEHHELKSFRLPAYTSTSLAKGVAQNFSMTPPNSVHHYKNGTKFGDSSHSDHLAHHAAVKDLEDQYHGGKIKPHEFHDGKGELEKRYGKLKDHHHHHDDHHHDDDHCPGFTPYKHLIRIHVPEGSHALYTRPASQHKHEHEVVLHKNAKVRIHPEPEVEHTSEHVVWHAKLIHDGVGPTRHATDKEIKRFDQPSDQPEFKFPKRRKK